MGEIYWTPVSFMGPPPRTLADGAISLLLLLVAPLLINSAEVTRHRVRTMDVVVDSNFDNGMNRILHDEVSPSMNNAENLESKGHKEDEHQEKHKKGGFGYENNGPRGWGQQFPRCEGQQQSPVSLDTSTVTTMPRPHLLWWNYFLKPVAMQLVNDGHTVKLYARWEKPRETPFLWSSPNGTKFVFDHIHFHWGPNDTCGSEHTLNNQRFPLEMHAVHFRQDLHSVQNSLDAPGGLRVVSVLFRISERNSSGLQPVTALLQEIQRPGSKVDVHPFSLSILLPVFSKQYLTYNGSLTTPPCFETVLWVVRKEPLSVSSYQMKQFRSILSSEGGYNIGNYRPPQPINGRDIVHI